MVKLILYDPPPDLADAMSALLSPSTKAMPPTGPRRTRRKAKIKKAARLPARRNRALWALCIEAALAYCEEHDLTNHMTYAADCYTLAVADQYPPHYWHRPPYLSSETYSSTPTSVPRDPVKPQTFPDPYNKQTRPTYPAGTVTSDPPGAWSQTDAQYHHDTKLSWRVYSYALQKLHASRPPTKMLARWDTTITVQTSNRPSRPMFSQCAFAHVINNTVEPPAAPLPPHKGGQSIYLRFKPKVEPPPFYRGERTPSTRAILNIWPFPYGATDYSKIELAIGPMPMLGYRYANNTYVTVTHQRATPPAIYIPRRPPPIAATFLTTSAPWRIYDALTGAITLTAAQPAGTFNGSNGRTILITLTDGTVWVTDENLSPTTRILPQDDPLTGLRGIRATNYGWHTLAFRIDYSHPETNEEQHKHYGHSGRLISAQNIPRPGEYSPYSQFNSPTAFFPGPYGTEFFQSGSTIIGVNTAAPSARLTLEMPASPAGWCVGPDALYCAKSDGEIQRALFPELSLFTPANPTINPFRPHFEIPEQPTHLYPAQHGIIARTTLANFWLIPLRRKKRLIPTPFPTILQHLTSFRTDYIQP